MEKYAYTHARVLVTCDKCIIYDFRVYNLNKMLIKHMVKNVLPGLIEFPPWFTLATI